MRIQQFGRYELLAELGRGGMAELYLGRLGGLGGFTKLVAIKRILPHLSDDPQFVAMFMNEARIAAQLSHPNVCSVFELGEVSGQLFIAMEYLEGVAWDDLASTSPVDPVTRLRHVAAVFAQACEGLHYAHSLCDLEGRPTPVVHRDVSPQNLFVTVEGGCKLLDFGVSKVMTEPTRTQSGLLKGKLPYMSPEQLRAESLDTRSDVFSMGVVVWEALTGERLFQRSTDFLMFKAVSEDDIPLVSSVVPELAAVDACVARALDRDRERRTPSIRVFGNELRELATAVGGALSPPEIGAFVRSHCGEQLAERARKIAAVVATPWTRMERADTPAPGETAPSMVMRDRSVAIARRRRAPVIAVAGAIALVGGVTAVVIASSRGGSPPASAAPAVAAVPLPPPPPDAGSVAADATPTPPPLAAAGPHPTAHRNRSKPATGRDPGFFSVDSTPYATIYIDGKRRDQTPLFHIGLSAGPHQIRAALADGRERTFTVEIEPGKDTSSGTLAW